MTCRDELSHAMSRIATTGPRVDNLQSYRRRGRAPTKRLGIRLTAFPCGAPNELTLSCKSRPPAGAPRGGVAAATERASEGAKCGCHAAVQFRAARGGSAAGPTVRRFLSACEGSWAALHVNRRLYCWSSHKIKPLFQALEIAQLQTPTVFLS